MQPPIIGESPARSVAARDPLDSGMGPARSIRDSVTRASYAWSVARAHGDTAAAARLLDDAFAGMDANGSVDTKLSVLHAMAAGKFRSGGFETAEVRVTVADDAAVVVARTHFLSGSVASNGGGNGGQYRMTEVYVRRRDGWKLLSEQDARLELQHIVPEDSIAVAGLTANLLQTVAEHGRQRGTFGDLVGPRSTMFGTGVPVATTGYDANLEMLRTLDLPADVYAELSRRPPYPGGWFHPEDLRIQLLDPEAAVVTFELRVGNAVYPRTIVLRRDHGSWHIAHVHASTVVLPARPNAILTLPREWR